MKRLQGKKAFVAGVGDEKGFGFAIAKALIEEGCEVAVGTWPPVLKIFTASMENKKLEEARRLQDGSLLSFAGIYPLDASFDEPEHVPAEVRENKRYKEVEGYSISEVVTRVHNDMGPIDILVHSLANAPEVQRPLMETTRQGYLQAMSASAYSFVSLVSRFAPFMRRGASALTLTYIASEKVIPGYGGGMSSAKAALESDTRVLAYEAGVKYGMRVNAISAGAYGSRAAKAIGFIEKMIEYSKVNAPLQMAIETSDVAQSALFLVSDAARAITGEVLYVDAGLHAMGVSVDSPAFTPIEADEID